MAGNHPRRHDSHDRGGQCSIKIVDKKTDKVLVDQSWTRGKKNGTLDDFIKAVFLEFGKQLDQVLFSRGRRRNAANDKQHHIAVCQRRHQQPNRKRK